ncbi:MAG: radical SAM family heme chaperone HemW [Nitrospinae bacterium]|nr:radical SAM family heme chaperone HemW [Nitrospinota bacterium]
MKRDLGVYIHIPFCIKKCSYCDFNSYSNMEEIFDKYVESVKKEISLISYQPYEVISIFFGGGTPTILESRQLIEILDFCKGVFNLRSDAEITIEANPETLTLDKLKELRMGGFNRISIGIQSFNDRLLRRLGRIHNSEKACQQILSVRDAGFENISIDLMFGIPDETIDDWESDIKTAIKLNIEHISTYNLTIEKGTPFEKLYSEAKASHYLPDEDKQLEMYEKGIELLISAGYEHYEISNFAKANRRCLHNQIYWRNEEYIGIGAGAYSYINGERRWNEKNPTEYTKAVMSYELRVRRAVLQSSKLKAQSSQLIAGRERLEEKSVMGETIMMWLRMIDGINLQSFKNRFDIEIQSAFPSAVSKLLDKGLITFGRPPLNPSPLCKGGLRGVEAGVGRDSSSHYDLSTSSGGEKGWFDNGNLRLTHKGLLFYNDVAAEFLWV